MSKRRKSGRRRQARTVRIIIFLVVMLFVGLALFPSDKRTASTSSTASVTENAGTPTAAPADAQTADQAATGQAAGQAADQAAAQAGGTSFQLSDVPAYAGAPYVAVNNNVPYFSDSDMQATSFEQYGDLDSLGRCTTAYACIGQDLMASFTSLKLDALTGPISSL